MLVQDDRQPGAISVFLSTLRTDSETEASPNVVSAWDSRDETVI